MKTFDDLVSTFHSGRTKDLQWRVEQLTAIERMMSERENEFIDALQQDLGKHALEAWMTEISYVAGDAAYCRKNLRSDSTNTNRVFSRIESAMAAPMQGS